eukprot:TRINITY_DN284_c1_g8_i1.p1 TRINITY_DN284_c1_g8~~TRINITY_DN284_c1_g8_i1.p1  ORF type:complete len:413 (-),score=45.32 TRINITY_DN284_c1_g8_i1:120-1358(-)
MPKNSLDRLRYLVLLKDETTIRDLGVEQKDASPTRNELKELEYSYCYLHHSVEDPKGWRNDGFRASWDCKSHWSYPMRGKLRRKIDKITIDSSRELHRWATQLNTVSQNPATPTVQTYTLVEYFMKSKSKQLPITKSPFGATAIATIDTHKINKLSESINIAGDKDQKRKPVLNGANPPAGASGTPSPLHLQQGNDNMLALLNYEATKELSHIPSDFHGGAALKNNGVRPPMGPVGPMNGMPNHGADWNYYRSLTPTYEYNMTPYMNFRPIPEAFTPPYSGTPIPPASPTLPPSISPMDWNAWQHTLHCWAVYLDGLPPSEKSMIWSYCRSSPHFQAYDVDSFVALWHRWSQSFHTNAPAISVFCAALDNFRNLFQGPDWRQGPVSVGGYSEDALLRERARAKVMDVSSLVM